MSARKTGAATVARGRGWTVRRMGPGWQVRVRVGGRYLCETWPTLAQARTWAEREAAKAALGQTIAGGGGSLSDLVDLYLEDLTRRGRRPKTVADAGIVLRRWMAEGGVSRLVPGRTLIETERWLDGLRALSPATRNRFRVTVKGLCHWAVRRGLLGASPLLALSIERVDQRLPPMFSIDELRQIVGAFGKRLHLRCCLMLYLGLRHQEAIFLRWCDIDLAARVAMVRLDAGGEVKRRKERMVPIPEELLAILGTLTRPARAEAAIAGRPTARNLSRDFSNFLGSIGIEQGERTAHSLRHAYASIATATGVPSLLLRSYLGHESSSTTAIYAQLAPRYASAVADWARGGWRLLEGLSSKIPRKTPT